MNFLIEGSQLKTVNNYTPINGQFGPIRKSFYEKQGVNAVVKRIEFLDMKKHLQDSANEVSLLVELQHPSLCKFYGICLNSESNKVDIVSD